ncbi:MAG: hypothetical protein HYY22_09130 [Thaumarchaeota archaeon]|nr:hypothetical protein [Nitrososphaerota archaeon]
MDIQKTSKQMAEDIVNAYIQHDKKDYARSALYFAKVFRNLFPKLPEGSIQRAARAYVDALRNHDGIEEGGYSKYDQFNHGKWSHVKDRLLEMCKALGLPDEYAVETTEFFRYHGVGDMQFVTHMLNADRIFTSSILENTNLSLVLGGLYLACVSCHDMHNNYGVSLGKNLISIYYFILLEN